MDKKDLAKASLSTTGKSVDEIKEILRKVGDMLDEAGVPSFCAAVYAETEDDDGVVSYLSNFNCSHITMYEMFYAVTMRDKRFADFFTAFGLAMQKAMDTGMYQKAFELHQQMRGSDNKTNF